MSQTRQLAERGEGTLRRKLLVMGILAIALLVGGLLIYRFDVALGQLLSQAEYEVVGRLSLWTMMQLLVLMCMVFGVMVVLWDRTRMMDQRRLQQEREELKLSQESLGMVFRILNGCLFEYDLEEHRFLQLENFTQLLGEDKKTIQEAWEGRGRSWALQEGAGWEDVVADCYHPDDRERVREGYRMLSQEGQVVLQVRIMSLGRPVWCRMHLALIYGSEGRARRVIGNVLDISDTRHQMEQLRAAAEQDPLTGLCNRSTFQDCVQQVLNDRREQTHAFLLLDVDDFKAINDSRGHIFGDHVLREAAQQIRNLFRTGDVVGRLGGDEFVVFMRNVHNRDRALEKVRELCTLDCDCPGGCACEGKPGDFCLSISVGVTFSHPGMDYHTLYRQADTALYRAKELGKNGFSVYETQEERRGSDIDGPVPPVV